jgi:hypothetical protein
MYIHIYAYIYVYEYSYINTNLYVNTFIYIYMQIYICLTSLFFSPQLLASAPLSMTLLREVELFAILSILVLTPMSPALKTLGKFKLDSLTGLFGLVLIVMGYGLMGGLGG